MIEIRRTAQFERWLARLDDGRARARILARIDRLGLGNFGDFRSVASRVSELRIDYGPGYRVYFTRKGSCLIVLLGGGDKSTQERDIRAAVELAAELS